MDKNVSARVVPLLVLPLVFSADLALAEDQNWGFSLGAFITDFDTTTNFDSSQGSVGFDTDFEEDLGLDDSDNVFRFDAYYKFNSRHRLDASVFDLSRNGSGILTSEIEFGDKVFEVNSLVETDFDLSVFKVAYSYSLIDGEAGYLGLSGGLYVADAEIALTGVATGFETESASVTAPLPVVGFRGEYQLNDRWTLRGSTEFFFLEFEDFSGSLFDLYGAIDYQLFENVAVGVGANLVELDVDTDGERFIGAFDWKYSGANIYLKFDF